jgi:thymidylate synthase (FAD)
MLDTVAAWVPVAHQAFLDYRLGAVALSAQMLTVVRRMLAGEPVDQPGSGLNRREWAELMTALGRGDSQAAAAGAATRG